MTDETKPDLTALEARLVALMLEGLSHSAALTKIGVDAAEHEAALREKLDLDASTPLREFVEKSLARKRSEPAAPDSAGAEPGDERRIRLLLRLTISELMSVAADSELRADILEHTVSTLGTEDPEGARREADALRQVADRVGEMVKQVLEQIRALDA